MLIVIECSYGVNNMLKQSNSGETIPVKFVETTPKLNRQGRKN